MRVNITFYDRKEVIKEKDDISDGVGKLRERLISSN